MTNAANPVLEPGRVYRTRDFTRYGRNPTRLVGRLVRAGRLQRAAHGLFYAPTPTKFGLAPPSETDVIRRFLGDDSFVVTGPPRWNALGLGATAMFSATLVYNTKRTGTFTFDGREFILRRVLFPIDPPAEWFVVDLIQHHEMAGVALADIERHLSVAIARCTFDPIILNGMAEKFGTKATQALVRRCLKRHGDQ